MSVFRVLPSKTNTIYSGSYQNLNSGQNMISNLWYGGTGISNCSSRFLIKFDLTDLQSKFNDCEINLSLVTSYNLVIKNSIPNDDTLETENKINKLYKSVAASFDLICFPINMDWDEGRGYDVTKDFIMSKVGSNIPLTGYSNWNFANSATSWSQPGVFTNPTASTSNYVAQHFDLGNEDLKMDVTSLVNDWMSGGSQNYGFAIAYRRDYELLTSDTRYISSFLTNKTNTAFKPYLEVCYDQTIKDDRKVVSNNRNCNLFFYAFSGHNPVNIVLSATTVDIKMGTTVVYSGLTPTQLQKGVYYVSVWMSGTTEGQKYNDVWRNIQFNPPFDSQDITQTFQIQKNYYTNFLPKINNYILDVYGIENNSIISQQENIRVFCDLRTAFSTQAPTTPYELQYKLTMNNQIDVIDWTPVNRAVFDGCETNFIDLDSSWLLNNQTYKFSFKINEMGTGRILPETLVFNVLREFI